MKIKIRPVITIVIALSSLLIPSSFEANASDEEPIGFATVAGNTAGGGNETSTTVTNFAELKAAAQDNAPRVIVISGTIKTTDGGGYALEIKSNKTIAGANKHATIYGGISLKNATNVIIRNLNIHGTWPNPGPDDAVSLRNSHHIWLDHLNIWDATDGNLDITSQSSCVTVSWCKFWFTDKRHPHRLCALTAPAAATIQRTGASSRSPTITIGSPISSTSGCPASCTGRHIYSTTTTHPPATVTASVSVRTGPLSSKTTTSRT